MEALPSRLSRLSRGQQAALTIAVALSCLRLAHAHLLWADEDYHLAAAINLLHGRIPYRDFWYDKPPLSAVYYVFIGGYSGWVLRAFDALYVLVACGILYRLAKLWWTEVEGLIAVCLLAYFLAFYLPSAVIPFAADGVMLVPHLLAVYYAALRKPFWAGAWAGISFLANIKGLFVLAVCALWLLPELPLIGLGFSLPVCAGLLYLSLTGAWSGYVEQVWRWGLVYAAGSPVLHPWANGLLRTANWAGFHFPLIAGSACAFVWRRDNARWRLGMWILLSYAAVCLGMRFAPHYFLQLLPPLVLVASRGISLAWQRRRRFVMTAFVIALVVPLIRFGPRYAMLAYDNLRGLSPVGPM